MFSRFFIDRPRFAAVLSIVLMIAGTIVALGLPVRQYPNVVPPQIQVLASYPGADAATLAKTVAQPLEEAINGVDDMIYMSSTSDNAGSYSLSVVFATGTDTNMALVKVQNRIQQAGPKLPKEVTDRGITANSSFTDTLGMIALVSPGGTRDQLYLTDYALSNVANALKRIPGMGNVQVMGSKYSIRVWLDPERLSALGLSTSDVANAIAGQNKQAAIGSIGTAPSDGMSGPLVYSLTTTGRLSSAAEFGDIVLRTARDGMGMVVLSDVARIELGAENYTMRAGFEGVPSATISLSQGSDSNALDVMKAVKKVLADLESALPSDMKFVVSLDTTDYVRATIREILTTLLITFSLVVAVCWIFLQDWRVTLVPVAAIPISLLATFMGLAALGYSINILTLFGLVLVIGTVVDDAIVVVERVLFIMERDGCDPRDATIKAMKDVSGPMLATTLIFLAIFVPVIFAGGMTGVIYRQFAVTISVSVCFSTLVAFTLSPAMCASLLRRTAPKTHGPLGWFNKALAFSTKRYVAGASWIARRTTVTLALFALVLGGCWMLGNAVPPEFIPDEDQGTVFVTVQLPEGASQQRYEALVSQMIPRIREVSGVRYVTNVNGFIRLGGTGENVGSLTVPLQPWDLRTTPETARSTIVEKLRRIALDFNEAQINVYTPPAITGLGAVGGLDLRLESILDDDPEAMTRVLNDFLQEIRRSPEFLNAFSLYTSDTPHLNLDIDRQKAEMLGVSLPLVFGALQTYFGTIYVNDVNIGTQVNKVILQADRPFRQGVDSVSDIRITASTGEQIPIQSFMTLKKILAPRVMSRYNLYPSASVSIFMRPGYSTGQGMARIAELATEYLPAGYTFEWSGMTYQEQASGGQIGLILCIAVLFGYLFLVAQYESWTVPLSVILSLPVAFLGALVGIFVMKITLSIYTQLGILLLVGLAAKNAILIVEFAKEQHEEQGLPVFEAAIKAAGERFRSVMMTAVTCVLGVLPMLFATGAGANSRLHVGTTMFFGMGMATAFGIFLIPGFYVLIQSGQERLSRVFVSHPRKTGASVVGDVD